jgi:hypothetical protein
MRTTAALLVAVAASLWAGPVSAGDATRDRVVKLPETAADHVAAAKGYEDRAAAWRQEAALHRDMAAAYGKTHPASSEAAMMEKHCGKLAADAEKLAEDADTMAGYHRVRAKELQRK